jgi:hypothetical protein
MERALFMRKRKVDVNQPELVDQIRQIPGVSVRHTHMVGAGFVDLVVGFRGKNFLLELKNPDMPPSKRKLTPDEEKFFKEWTGQVAIVHNLEDVLKIINQKK